MKVIVPVGATKKRKRCGRGPSSGIGKTSGRGMKGQKARNTVRPGFEGGQMPLYRRIARRGFTNAPFKRHVDFVNIADLERCFKDKDSITVDSLKAKRLIKKSATLAKILSEGTLNKSLVIDETILMSKVASTKLTKAKCTFVPMNKAANKEDTAKE